MAKGDDSALTSILRSLGRDKREKVEMVNNLVSLVVSHCAGLIGRQMIGTDECAIGIFRAGVRDAVRTDLARALFPG